MIDPLRFAKEVAPPHIIDQAVFCGVCLADRKTRKNPKIASKFCHDCFKNNYMCLSCDAKEHGLMKTKHHIRSLLVVGPPVRKKVLTRGDAVHFPMFLDDVKIKMKARVFDNGKLVQRTPVTYYEFKSGLSGDSIHVQVLGCKNLLASDAHGSSDPFITAVYCGVPLGATRTRHRTVNPKWTNETYVVPCASDLPPPREESFSQKNLLRLEVFDRDYLTSNDFLGHVELSRKKLIDMANYSKGQPLNLNLTARHHHGTISVRLGTNEDIMYIRVVGGESLEKTDGFGLSDPFCKVYFKGRLVGTTPVCKNTVTPKWTRNNSFAVGLAEVLDEEERITELLKDEEQAARRGLRRGGLRPLAQSTGGSSRDVRAVSTKDENEDTDEKDKQIQELNSKSLFVLELYDYNNFNPSQLLGHVRVPVEALRKLVPILPSEEDTVDKGTSVNHVLFRAKSAAGRFFRGEKVSARLSGKWENAQSAKGFNDNTESEKLRQDRFAELNDPNRVPTKALPQKKGMSDAKIQAQLLKNMSARVGDVSGVFDEADEEEESMPSPSRLPVRDQIENVGISALLAQDIDGGSSYETGSVMDGGSSITSYDPQGSVERASIIVPNEEAAHVSTEVSDAPHRLYSSLSNRPRPPEEEGTGGFLPDGADDSWAHGSAEGSGIQHSNGKLSASHDDDYDVENRDSGSLYGTVHSHLSASEKALDAMYSQQMDDDMASDDENEDRVADDGENDLAEELLENSSSHEGSEIDDKVPPKNLRSRGSGEMGEDGVFLEENEALLRRTNRRRSSLFQTMVGTLGFVSADDLHNAADDEEDSGFVDPEAGQMLKSRKKNQLAENMKMADIDNSCFRAIKRALFGEVRWSQVAFFPVVKYKLSEEDLDCYRGEITIRVIRSNRGKVLRGLDSGVRNMSLGETAQIKVRYDRAYSSFCLGNSIPPRANIVFTVELITINGAGKWGMPLRQLKRIGRFFWKIKDKTVNAIERAYWRAKKKYKGVIDITGPPESYYMQSDDDESYASSVDSFGSFQPEDDEEDKKDNKLSGVHLGAKIMWGFQPEKRPVKKKKIKTEYEKLMEKQAYIAKKRSEKAAARRQQKSIASHDSALNEHDKLLNLGLGDDVDVNYQLGEGSVQSCINEDGSITSSKVDLTKNDITDDLLEVEAAHNNANSLKLDLDQLHDDGDGSSANSSKKSKRSGEKKTESKKSKRRDSLSKEYKIR